MHTEDPESWTVERICDSFPIGVESCRKLLRSKWAPRTLAELRRHDRYVMENWAELVRGNGDNDEMVETGGPAINIYDEMERRNRISLFKYATGMPDVYFERKAQIFSDSYSIHKSYLCVSNVKFIISNDN